MRCYATQQLKCSTQSNALYRQYFNLVNQQSFRVQCSRLLLFWKVVGILHVNTLNSICKRGRLLLIYLEGISQLYICLNTVFLETFITM